MKTESVTDRWEAFLAKHKVNQTGAAKRAGISPPMISAYKGGVSRPSPDTLRRIAQAFGENYQALREQLYPSSSQDDVFHGPSGAHDSGAGRGGGERDSTAMRLACLAAAAAVLSGKGTEGSTVTALAQTFEEWVTRP